MKRMVWAFGLLISLSGLAMGDSIDDALDKNIRLKVEVGPKATKVKEIRHPDGTIETIYDIGPSKPKVGIREEPPRYEDDDELPRRPVEVSAPRRVPCEVAGRQAGLRTQACECGPTCKCDGCDCKPGYKCDANGCTPIQRVKTQVTEDNIPVITADGKRYKNRAEYEASLRRTQAPRQQVYQTYPTIPATGVPTAGITAGTNMWYGGGYPVMYTYTNAPAVGLGGDINFRGPLGGGFSMGASVGAG